MWGLIVFQILFFGVICLASLSTIIDVAKNRPPAPFGTQHIGSNLTFFFCSRLLTYSLVLMVVGWGPLIVFGRVVHELVVVPSDILVAHIQDVRQRLILCV
jgi:hypothetical protein